MSTLLCKTRAGAGVILFAAGVVAATTTVANSAQQDAPRQWQTPCPFEYAAATCAFITVPENRAGNAGNNSNGDNGNSVTLFIVDIKNPNYNTGAAAAGNNIPAIILGGGGPGGGLALNKGDHIAAWDDFRKKTLGEDGRLILTDQRGAGMSRPLLNCPAEKTLYRALLANPRGIDEEARLLARALVTCRNRLTRAGVNIAAYTTNESADDIEDIRKLLAIPQWRIIGFSYGARLAMEVIRRHPNGVAAALLDSPAPYDARDIPPAYPFARAVDKIAAGCARQQSCRRHGALKDNLRQARRQAARGNLQIKARYNTQWHTIHLTPERLLDLLHFGVYTRTGAAALPFFARQLAAGDTDNENARSFAYTYLWFLLDDEWASMLNWHINCAENQHAPQPPAGDDFIAQTQYRYFNNFLKICAALNDARDDSGVSDVSDDSDKSAGARPPAPPPVIPDAAQTPPILIISGEYDPTTPPEWGAAMAARLSGAQHIIAPDSHTPSVSVPCLMQSIAAFFESPLVKIPPYCSDEKMFFY